MKDISFILKKWRNLLLQNPEGRMLNTDFMAKSSNIPKTPDWILRLLVDVCEESKKPPISLAGVQSRGLYEDKINPTLAKKLNKDT